MREYEVTLETSWASMYHDLALEGLRLVRRPVALRTQTKNAIREDHLFAPPHFRTHSRHVRVGYTGAQVLTSPSGTVLEAMCNSVGVNFAEADFSLPVPDEWYEKLDQVPGAMDAAARFLDSGKPLMLYRPLCARPEWRGSAIRNANPEQYAELLASIRDSFYVISVADLVPRREWIVGPQLKADAQFHEGQLVFEALAALFKMAQVVYTSSGFPTIMAQAVGTPVVSIVGGYEPAMALRARDSAFLGIQPNTPCGCFTSVCGRPCSKVFDMLEAKARLRQFLTEQELPLSDMQPRTMAQMFGPPTDPESTATPATPFAAAIQRGITS